MNLAETIELKIDLYGKNSLNKHSKRQRLIFREKYVCCRKYQAFKKCIVQGNENKHAWANELKKVSSANTLERVVVG